MGMETEWPVTNKVKPPKFYKQHYNALAFEIRGMYAELLDSDIDDQVSFYARKTLEELACRLARRFENERKGNDEVAPFDRELWFKACAPDGYYDSFVEQWEGYVDANADAT